MSAGYCSLCEAPCRNALLVQCIDSGSGPGTMLYACPDHARQLATRPDAPTWLRTAIADLDNQPQPLREL